MASHYGDVLREGALAVGDLKQTSWYIQVTPPPKNTRKGTQRKFVQKQALKKIQNVLGLVPHCIIQYEGKLGQLFRLVFHLLRKDSWLYSTADGFWCLSKKASWAPSTGRG